MDNSLGENFGTFIKQLRGQKKLSLRSFCLEHDLDAGNHSKMERGILPPPKNKDKLIKIAKALEIKEGSAEWDKFFDLAAITSGIIPDYIMDNDSLLDKLPIFFRTLDGQKIDDSKLEELINLIKKQ